MDRRQMLALVLCIGLYYAWVAIKQPFGPAPGEEVVEEPVAEQVQPEAQPEPVAVVPTPRPASEFPVRQLPFDQCGATGDWSTDGGVLRNLTLRDHRAPFAVQPLYSWVLGLVTGGSDFPWKPYGEEPDPVTLLGPEGDALALGAGDVGAAAVSMRVVSEDPLIMEGVTEDGLSARLEVLSSDEEPCVTHVRASWKNESGSAYNGPVWVGVHDLLPEPPGGMLGRYSSIRQVLATVDGDLEYGPTDDFEVPVPVEGPLSWFGLADKYFALFVLPTDGEGSFTFNNRGEKRGGTFLSDVQIARGQVHQQDLRVYIGPMDLDVMRAVDQSLNEAVDLGLFAFFAHPLLFLLKVFHSGVQNWGLSIILLTLLVKLVFFPMTQKAFKSGQAMSALQPEMKRLKEEFKDDQEELNKRTLALFQKHKVNPLGGCLPMFIQFPVWVALYNVLLSSVDLYHTRFLYLKDLSSPDPYCILPAIVVGLMMLQQQFTPTGNMEPAQARMMKLMPLMFGVLFFTFPSGLVVYIFMNVSLSILQQWIIRRNFPIPAPA